MKKYTQEDFDKFEIIDGIKQCPTGDYTNIELFAKGCSFAEGCSFAKGCSFAEWCSFAKGCKAISPYWGFVYKPEMEIKNKIFIPYKAYSFWRERFDIDIDDDYPTNQNDKIKDILKNEKLTECEKIILESWI